MLRVRQQDFLERAAIVKTLGILAMFLSVFSLWAQTSQSPEGLYDAGDYYVLRDQSIVPLLRSAQEIAVRRAKTVPNQDILRASGADRVLESFDACGATTTHQIEIYSVRNITAARSGLGTLDGVMWVSPVLSVPDSGKRLLLSDQIIVQFEDESVMNGVADDVLEELASRGFEIARPPLASAPGQYLLRFDHWDAELAFAEAVLMARVPGVAWAEPNFIVDLDLHVLPNDPYFPWQQGLHNTGQNGGLINADVEASEAWDIRTGNDRLVIAIIDTGVDTGHPDLRIFRNEAEWGDGREANGVDNDGNGYADDYQGWDFYGNDNNPNPGSGPNTTDGSPSHGTACAGVAGAIGNNGLGIAGAVWKCRILPVKINSDTGSSQGMTLDAIAASIRYAAQYADVISCSWGGLSLPSSAIESAIDYATTSGRGGRGSPVFFAAGNNAAEWEFRTRIIRCTVPASGNYRIEFRAYTQAYVPVGYADLMLDQLRVLSTNGYDHLWRDDFEGGAAGWTFAHGGGLSSDWYLDAAEHQWPGSSYYFHSPNFALKNAGWAELRTPAIWLPVNTGFVAFMPLRRQHYPFEPWVRTEVRLLDLNNQPLQLLNPADADKLWSYTRMIPGISYPASYAASLAVGASTDLGMRAFYSQYAEEGADLFCVAPSHGGWNSIVTTDTQGTAGANSGTWSNGDYRVDFGGTSAATPLAAGVATLVLSKNANLSLTQLKNSLRLGCEKIGGVTYDGAGWHAQYGYGQVNAYNSLNNTPADVTAPTVLSVSTKTGRAIEVTFSEQMGIGVTSASSYTVSGTGKGTLSLRPASVTWVSGNTFLLEWTAGEMIVGTGNITITVGTIVRDIGGNAMGNPRSGVANGSRVIHALSCGQLKPDPQYPIAPFESDRYWTGVGYPGYHYGVSTFHNDDGTPDGVLISYRFVSQSGMSPGDIFYTLPGVSTGVNHEVRLYFFNGGLAHSVGDAKFDIYVNSVLKYSNLDLFLESGGNNNAFWKSFSNITASSGSISVRISPRLAYHYTATISGITITAQ